MDINYPKVAVPSGVLVNVYQLTLKKKNKTETKNKQGGGKGEKGGRGGGKGQKEEGKGKIRRRRNKKKKEEEGEEMEKTTMMQTTHNSKCKVVNFMRSKVPLWPISGYQCEVIES